MLGFRSFAINLVRCSSPGAVGPVETRRGEGRCAFSPGTHLASHLRHLQTPKCRVGPRARCVSSPRVLMSVSWENIAANIFFSISEDCAEKRLFARILCEFYLDYLAGLSLANSESSRSRLWRGLVYGTYLRWWDSRIRWNLRRKSERTLEKSSGIVIKRVLSLAELYTRVSDANGANKGAALVKTPSIYACVEGRYSLCLGKPDFYVWRTCSREERRGGGISSPATGKSCLPIHTCVQGRPSKTWNCNRSGITIVSPMASPSGKHSLFLHTFTYCRENYMDLRWKKIGVFFRILDLSII